MLSTLAYATNHEGSLCISRRSDVLDPASATGASVVLHQLLWIRCASNVEHAFKATDLLLQGGGFGLVCAGYRRRASARRSPNHLVVVVSFPPDSGNHSHCFCRNRSRLVRALLCVIDFRNEKKCGRLVSGQQSLSLPDSSYETTHSSSRFIFD